MANPGFYYDYLKVRKLVDMWNRHWPDEAGEWDLDLRHLRKRLFGLEDFDQIEEEQKLLNEVCQELKRKPIPFPSLNPSDYVRRLLVASFDRITGEMLILRRKMHVGYTSPFPNLLNRPTSSQLAATSPFPVQATSSQISMASNKGK